MSDLEEITGGYSGAKLIRIRHGEQDLCVKIMPRGLEEKSARRVREICEIYRNMGIDSLTFRGYGELEEGKHFYIYDYIDGESFKEYSNRELLPDEIRIAGKRLGQKLRTLKLDKNLAKSTNLSTDNIEKLTKYGVSLHEKLAKEVEVAKLMREYFDTSQIETLMKEFEETANDFRKIKPGLIHGDLKRSNMVRGRDGKVYLIDVESMRKSYDVLNLRYQITWILFPGAEKEREFVRGIFDGLYDGKRPEGFDKQLRYVLMLNFLEHTMKAQKRGEGLREYFGCMQGVFEQVKNVGEQSLL